MDAASITNNIAYLYNLSNAIPNTEVTKILKTYYLVKCRILEMRSKTVLPAAVTKSSVRCPRCCLPLTDVGVTYKFEPQKTTKLGRRLLRKNDRKESLTKYQLKYLDKVKTLRGNKLVATCKLCKKEVKTLFVKPKSTINNKNKESESSLVQKQRTKRKKDRFSGLDSSVVLSATPQKIVPINKKIKQDTPVSQCIKQKPKVLIDTLRSCRQKPQIQTDILSSKNNNKSIKRKAKRDAKVNSLTKILNEHKQNSAKPRVKTPTMLQNFLTSLSL